MALNGIGAGVSFNVLAQVYFLRRERQFPESLFLPSAIIGAAVGVAGWLAILRWLIAPHFGRAAARRLVAAAACPACGFSLAGVPADAGDGCTVCPECGAAWRVAEGQVDGNRP
jgi:hypothetical protein